MSYNVTDLHQCGRRTVSSPGLTGRVGRRKAAHSKVRTGCDNCKQRRIKCDEARPTCLRCARSDLICKGYHPPEVKLFELNRETPTCTSDREQLEIKEESRGIEDSACCKSSAQYHMNTLQYAGGSETRKALQPQVHPSRPAAFDQMTPPPEHQTLAGTVTAIISELDEPASQSRSTAHTADARLIAEHAGQSDSLHFPASHRFCDQDDFKRTEIPPRRGTGQIQRPLKMWEGCTEVEIRGLHFFFEKTLPVLKIFSSSAEFFFTVIVPHMSSYESAIRHQVIALGLAHQRSLSISNSGIWINVARNYGYALRCLTKNSEIEPHILLSSCLLLLAIEMLCDGPIPALNHLKSGLRMLRDEETSKRSSKSATTHISRHLEPIFAQLAATSSPDGALSIARMRNLSPQIPDLSESFKSLDDANMKFLKLLQWTEYGGMNHDLSAAWTMWYQHLQTFRSQLDDVFSRSQIQAKLLHAHYLMVQFRAEQRATGDEMSWDLHVEEYRRQLDDCFAICVTTGYPEKYPTFGPDKLPGFDLPPGCFPPMWQVAIICRDPTVRRRAIDLIRIHHYRVGHNDECYGVLVATAIMHLEEGNLGVCPVQR